MFIFSPWFLRWPESPQAQTWFWSDRIWSHLLQWKRLSAQPALWLLVQKCSVGSHWCRRNPLVCWLLQTEWREKPLLRPNGHNNKKKKNNDCYWMHHLRKNSLTHKAALPLRLSLYHLCSTTLLSTSYLSKIELFAQDFKSVKCTIIIADSSKSKLKQKIK